MSTDQIGLCDLRLMEWDRHTSLPHLPLKLYPSKEPTMTHENIAAFTEADQCPPAYISVNTKPENKCSITVRSRGGKDTAVIEMTPEQLRQLATDILAKIGVQITDEMVLRFLSWELPQDFNPDCYITFDRDKSSNGTWPTGTNLFSAVQTRLMLEHAMQPTITQIPGLYFHP